jgi:hypothetical protein
MSIPDDILLFGGFTFGSRPGRLRVISVSRAAMFLAVIRSNPSLKRTPNGGAGSLRLVLRRRWGPLSFNVGPRIPCRADRPNQACKVVSGHVSIGLRFLWCQRVRACRRFTFSSRPGRLRVISFSRAAMIFAVRSNPSLKRTLNGGARWLASAGSAAPLWAA